MKGKTKRTNEERTIKSTGQQGLAINTCISIITFNVNGLSALIKTRVADWIKKTRIYSMLPTRNSL